MQSNTLRLQKYACLRSQVHFFIAFMIILISFGGCESDRKKLDESLSRKDQYFIDYQSPDHLWGFINKKGDLVIPAKFDDLRDFKNGQALVNFQGKWGVIDAQGNYLVQPAYLDIHDFENGFYLVEDFDSNKFYIDLNGEKAFDCPYDECYSFSGDYARVIDGNITGYLDKNGDILDGLNFTGGTDFNNGYAIVQLGTKYGIINTRGEKILPVEYDKIKVNENIATCKKNGVYTFFDLKTQSTLRNAYDKATIFEDGYSVVLNGAEHGIVDVQGRFKGLSKTKLRYLNEKRWSKQTEKGYTIIDENGIAISDSTYDNVFKFNCGVAGFERSDAWSYVTTEGKELFAPQLPIIWDCSEGYIRFISNRGYGFMDKSSSVMIAPKYMEARDFKEGMARVQVFQ